MIVLRRCSLIKRLAVANLSGRHVYLCFTMLCRSKRRDHHVRSITDAHMGQSIFPMKILPCIVISRVEVWDFPLPPCMICDRASVATESGVSRCHQCLYLPHSSRITNSAHVLERKNLNEII
jgi:hypothetical protein